MERMGKDGKGGERMGKHVDISCFREWILRAAANWGKLKRAHEKIQHMQ
jgi:hypothetical protein